jgi:cytochrome c oxidase cbb3-type subunit 4
MPPVQTFGEPIMTYDAVATISQVASLLMFIAMFIAVLAYALRPSNGTRFEQAQRVALELEHSPTEKSPS